MSRISSSGGPPRTRPRRLGVVVASVLWLAGSATGYARVLQYARAPGAAGAAPSVLPPESAVPREAGKPTLVVVLHPECPCSRATLGELSRLLARIDGRVAASAVFVRPPGVAPGWERGALWTEAQAIPHLTLLVDEGGVEATRLQAQTSGHALLFDADGALVFSGGITPARGHAGDSAGQDAILAHVLAGEGGAAAQVFGCPLLAGAEARP